MGGVEGGQDRLPQYAAVVRRTPMRFAGRLERFDRLPKAQQGDRVVVAGWRRASRLLQRDAVVSPDVVGAASQNGDAA